MLSGVSAAGSREIQYVVALDLARSRGADPRKHEEPVLMSRSEEHTSELQSRVDLVCRLLLEKEKLDNDWFAVHVAGHEHPHFAAEQRDDGVCAAGDHQAGCAGAGKINPRCVAGRRARVPLAFIYLGAWPPFPTLFPYTTLFR